MALFAFQHDVSHDDLRLWPDRYAVSITLISLDNALTINAPGKRNETYVFGASFEASFHRYECGYPTLGSHSTAFIFAMWIIRGR